MTSKESKVNVVLSYSGGVVLLYRLLVVEGDESTVVGVVRVVAQDVAQLDLDEADVEIPPLASKDGVQEGVGEAVLNPLIRRRKSHLNNHNSLQ
jgi:hypothetical protein